MNLEPNIGFKIPLKFFKTSSENPLVITDENLDFYINVFRYNNGRDYPKLFIKVEYYRGWYIICTIENSIVKVVRAETTQNDGSIFQYRISNINYIYVLIIEKLTPLAQAISNYQYRES